MQHYAINPEAVLQLYRLLLYGVASLVAFLGLLVFSIYFLLFVCGWAFQASQRTAAKTTLNGEGRVGRILEVALPTSRLNPRDIELSRLPRRTVEVLY